jgi:hypothetical protein
MNPQMRITVVFTFYIIKQLLNSVCAKYAQVSEGMIILSRSLPVKPATFHMPKQQARHFLTRQAQSKLASTHSWAIVKN